MKVVTNDDIALIRAFAARPGGLMSASELWRAEVSRARKLVNAGIFRAHEYSVNPNGGGPMRRAYSYSPAYMLEHAAGKTYADVIHMDNTLRLEPEKIARNYRFELIARVEGVKLPDGHCIAKASRVIAIPDADLALYSVSANEGAGKKRPYIYSVPTLPSRDSLYPETEVEPLFVSIIDGLNDLLIETAINLLGTQAQHELNVDLRQALDRSHFADKCCVLIKPEVFIFS